jgi:hypothetical protein
LDTDLRFDGWRRSSFQGMVECVFHRLELSPVATSNSTHAFFGTLGRLQESITLCKWFAPFAYA